MAASYYYYAVKQLEYGQVDETQKKIAEDGMVAACRYLIAIDDTDKDIWFQLWQRARYMARDVAAMDLNERKRLYKQEIELLDADYTSFFAAARKQHLTRASDEKLTILRRWSKLPPSANQGCVRRASASAHSLDPADKERSIPRN